jgi:hypothetical protein
MLPPVRAFSCRVGVFRCDFHEFIIAESAAGIKEKPNLLLITNCFYSSVHLNPSARLGSAEAGTRSGVEIDMGLIWDLYGIYMLLNC